MKSKWGFYLTKIINFVQDFSKYPGGRYITDGPYSGELFREQHLIPALESNEKVVIEFDGAAGYPVSFLEEAFGGLVRLGYTSQEILDTFEFHHSKEYRLLKEEIIGYITEQEEVNGN